MMCMVENCRRPAVGDATNAGNFIPVFCEDCNRRIAKAMRIARPVTA